ncbi:MAG TPA: saccharopine dehydrogenase NADP-binding domain-containing protein [Myxococcota bacterium]|nr:saccharopine dehydrogenase NADP-binding domain-containing protein [Myxococcota bacterium]
MTASAVRASEETSRWMLYGATGYTGALIAEEAVRRGHRPLLAGRSVEKLAALGERLGLEWLAVGLDDARALAEAVGRVEAVLHAAGPFVHTGGPMLRACLDAGASYLDITGEIAAFERTFAHDRAARTRGVTLLPGAGFDVVPTDCLARYVAERVPGATELELAIAALGGAPSAGTAKSVLEAMPNGNRVRRNGALVRVPMGQGARTVRFLCGERTVLPIPWGDLSTAWRTTNIGDITTYMALPPRQVRVLAAASPIAERVLSVGPLRRLALAVIGQVVKGPNAEARARGRSHVWARAADGHGREAQAWLETCDGYAFTALSSVLLVERVLAEKPPGAVTPAGAFGADFVLEIDETRRTDALGAT